MTDRVTYIPAPDGETEAPRISEDADLQAHFDEFVERTKDAAGDVTIRVYQVPTDGDGNAVVGNRANEFLFSCAVDQYELDGIYDKVKREYMGLNDRRMTIRMICTRKGTAGVLFNRIAVIRRSIAEPMAGPDPNATMMQAVERMLSNQQARNEAMFRSFGMQPTHAPAPDLVSQLLPLITPFVPVIAAWVGRPGPERQSMMEMLEVMKAARAFAAGAPMPGEETESGDSLSGIIKAASPFAPALTEIIKSMTAQRATAVVHPPAPPPAIAAPPHNPSQTYPPGQPGVAQPPAPPIGENVFIVSLAKDMTTLAGYIKANPQNSDGTWPVDPKAGAASIATGLPDELPAEATALLDSANPAEALGKLVPAVADPAVQPWFALMLAELKNIYSE